MNYIVLDLEWNQPFDFKKMVKGPVMLFGEIIQIGAVKLDAHYHILDTFKIMVAPKYYTKMRKTVTKLTGITTADLDYGFPFPVAFKHFQNWCGEDYAFLTWGPDDMEVLRSNMRLHSLTFERIPKAYNIQVIFDDQIAKENRQISLTDAMQKLGEPALKAHDALNDAKNTVCVCLHLDMARGMAEYVHRQSERVGYEELSHFMKTYPTRDAAFQDPELISFACPVCGDKVSCVDIIRQNYEKFICVGKCENGEEMLVRFKFKKLPDGSFRVARILREMDEENRRYYLNKKQQFEAAKAAYLQQCAGTIARTI